MMEKQYLGRENFNPLWSGDGEIAPHQEALLWLKITCGVGQD